MNPLFIIALIIWAITAIGLIILVLMHSGKGAGLSETFGGSMDPNLGTGVIEKNLNRITIICASIFIAMLILMMFIWPSNPALNMTAPETVDAAIEEGTGGEGLEGEHAGGGGNEASGDQVDDAWVEGIEAEQVAEDDGQTP